MVLWYYVGICALESGQMSSLVERQRKGYPRKQRDFVSPGMEEQRKKEGLDVEMVSRVFSQAYGETKWSEL